MIAWIVVLVIAVFVLQALRMYSQTHPRDAMNATYERREVDMFMCADSGNFSGRHELQYIYDAMVDVVAVNIPECQTAYFGYLVKESGERVESLLVTTGIYIINAVACTVNLMQDIRFKPRSIVFLGTAGISPTVGGWNPRVKGGCNALRSPQKNMLGSVCITDAAVLQECGVCIEEEVPSLCARPNCVMHNNSALFGRCAYRHATSLAASMRKAMEGKEFPKAPAVLREGMEAFWSSHQAVENRTPPRTPRLLNCAETDTSSIYAGAMSDYICREYSHALVQEVPFEEHTCVQAMEGIGFLHVMDRYPEVPIALVRAGSNYDMYPISRAGVSSEGTPLWVQNDSFMDKKKYRNFVRLSYRYAVLTANAVVLNYYTGKALASMD